MPNTMQVLTESYIEDSGYTDLRPLLDAQPGITVGTGENGNQFGDRYIIRGQEARSDVFVDGLRDPGMTTRETFAVDQVEISKGPNSTFAGRGTAGGAVNLITKQATTDYDFVRADIGLGTDRYVRGTVDANFVLGEDLAVRANVLYGYTEVPDRGPADRERKGAALSATWSPGDAFDITLDYYGLRAHDKPDIGDYLSGDGSTGNRLPVETPPYAQDQDFMRSHVDVFTGRVNWALSDNVKLTNRTRYGMSDNGYVVTAAAGNTTSATGPGGAYPTITFSTHQKFQKVDYFATQTNLLISSDMMGGKNDLIIGAEYTDHSVKNGNWLNTNTGAFNCRTGTAAGSALNNYCGIGADGRPVSNLNSLLGRSIVRGAVNQDYHVETLSAYVMDTLDITDALTVFGGVRFDTYDYSLGVTGGNPPAVTQYEYSDSFWNGHLGVTYELGELGMIYASVATAADINGGESDVGTNAGYGGLLLVDGELPDAIPERSMLYELGTKLNLFDNRFLLTASVFQIDKDDVFEAAGSGYTPTGTGNTGANRTRGFELGLAGNITPIWSFQGGLTVMDAEITKSAANPLRVGKTLSNFADFQASLLTRIQPTDAFALGFAVKHKSKRYAGQPDTAPAFTTRPDGTFFYNQPVPAYTVGDAFVEYRFNENIEFRLNANNLTDEKYYLAAYQSGRFLYKGDARQVVGTLTLRY
nr:TonB-dependent receptor [Tsuneonella aeria]